MTQFHNIALVATGDELLDGRVGDKNARWLGAQLTGPDVGLRSVEMVPDSVSEIANAVDRATKRADWVVVSGGLGPTDDDLARDAAAMFTGSKLEVDREMVETVLDRYPNADPSLERQIEKQASFPEDAEPLYSESGTAPGFSQSIPAATIFYFPGVPAEFKFFCRRYLFEKLQLEDWEQRRRNLCFFGLPESRIATQLESVCDDFEADTLNLQFQAAHPLVHLQITTPKTAMTRSVVERVDDQLGDWVVAFDRTVSEHLGHLLTQHSATATAAESCTAGGLMRDLTRTPGSSQWFDRGYVTYSNEAKVEMLGVAEQILDAYGAVSPQTASQMAVKALRKSGADYGVAISGIAGPSGGTVEKPVGTVDVSMCDTDQVWCHRFHFPNRSRRAVRRAARLGAHALLIWRLRGTLDAHDLAGPFSHESAVSTEGVPLENPEIL